MKVVTFTGPDPAGRHDAGDGRLRGMYAPQGRSLTRDIPVIFLTAKTEAEDETKGFEVGRSGLYP